MTQQTYSALQELQRIDEEIGRVKSRIAEFEPLLEEVDAPARELEKEVEATEERLQEAKLEERRLELAVEEKRERLEKLENRLNEVRNVREEAAVQAELDMLRRSAESDEQEAVSLLEQIRELEERLVEQEAALNEAREEVEPRRNELVGERESQREFLSELRDKRADCSERISAGERRVYKQIRSGGRDVVVAPLTPDGACSHCYGMVPVQRRNEVRHGSQMIRCEACGVILAPPASETSDEEGE